MYKFFNHIFVCISVEYCEKKEPDISNARVGRTTGEENSCQSGETVYFFCAGKLKKI